MTIKEFARLCGCNSQTLRYYDRIDLLKPVEVDQWSGYRFYEEEQALDFVKIKNLQLAGFTIDEIKELIGRSDEEIYRAFEVKLAEQEERIRTIREIQKSYQNEMENMKERLKEIQGKVYEEMERLIRTKDYDLIVVPEPELIVNNESKDSAKQCKDADTKEVEKENGLADVTNQKAKSSASDNRKNPAKRRIRKPRKNN